MTTWTTAYVHRQTHLTVVGYHTYRSCTDIGSFILCDGGGKLWLGTALLVVGAYRMNASVAVAIHVPNLFYFLSTSGAEPENDPFGIYSL